MTADNQFYEIFDIFGIAALLNLLTYEYFFCFHTI